MRSGPSPRTMARIDERDGGLEKRERKKQAADGDAGHEQSS